MRRPHSAQHAGSANHWRRQRGIVLLVHFTDVSDRQTLQAACGWRRGVVVSGVRRMNEVNARRARLLPGWVTVFGRVYHLGV